MKILDVVQVSDKVVFVQMEYGRGFEAGIKKEAQEKKIEIVKISALEDGLYTTKLSKGLQSKFSSESDEKIPRSPFESVLLSGNKKSEDGFHTMELSKGLQSKFSSESDKKIPSSPFESVLLSGNKWPEVKTPTAWLIGDFEILTKEKQVDLFNDLSNKIKENKDLKIVVPFNDFNKLSKEVCKNSLLIMDSSFLPPIGTPIDFSGFPTVDNLIEIRRKFTAPDSDNKNTPK